MFCLTIALIGNNSAMAESISNGKAKIYKSVEEITNQKTIWLDVRNFNEYQQDHIEGDLNIPIGQLSEDIEYHIEDKATPIKVYCQLGKRAEKATQLLKEMGYQHVECIGTIDAARLRRGIELP